MPFDYTNTLYFSTSVLNGEQAARQVEDALAGSGTQEAFLPGSMLLITPTDAVKESTFTLMDLSFYVSNVQTVTYKLYGINGNLLTTPLEVSNYILEFSTFISLRL